MAFRNYDEMATNCRATIANDFAAEISVIGAEATKIVPLRDFTSENRRFNAITYKAGRITLFCDVAGQRRGVAYTLSF